MLFMLANVVPREAVCIIQFFNAYLSLGELNKLESMMEEGILAHNIFFNINL